MKPMRKAGMIWLFATVQFMISMAIAQMAYGCANYGGCYNLLSNPISNLGSSGIQNGNPPYFTYQGSRIPWPTSPLWFLFNFSLALFGLLLVSGMFLADELFRKGTWHNAWSILLAAAGIGAMGVGLFPEDLLLSLHGISALIAFVCSGASLVAASMAMRADRRWSSGWQKYTLLSGVASLAFALALTLSDFGVIQRWPVMGNALGFGGLERLIIIPVILWIIAVSIRMLRK